MRHQETQNVPVSSCRVLIAHEPFRKDSRPLLFTDSKQLNHFQKDKVWSYRVWPYRILYRRVGSEWLDVLAIEPRKDVYR